MNYYELNLKLSDFDHWHDIFVAHLAEIDFESFVEEKPLLKAYIQEELFNGAALQNGLTDLAQRGGMIDHYDLKIIEQQNWNAEWESQFEPVFIANELRIVAPFHQLPTFDGIEIQILPKMSFGTGHHQTTHLICQQMLQMDFKDSVVLDMGSGTGVLAILAEQLGAKEIIAIEIEEWSAENILENIALNHCGSIKAIHGDASAIPQMLFDIVLANINKNVLLAQLASYSSALKMGGVLVLSGFFVTDAPDLIIEAQKHGFMHQSTLDKENWAVVLLTKIK